MAILTSDSVTSGGNAITARIWVNFNGRNSSAIRTHFNCSSVTRNGTGDYTVNYSSAVADSNQCFFVSGIEDNNNQGPGGANPYARRNYPSSSSQRIVFQAPGPGGNWDADIMTYVAFR